MNYDATLFTEKLEEFLTEDQVEKVLEVMENICHCCWDAYKGCQCWNDE